jgi:hypothetical protein
MNTAPLEQEQEHLADLLEAIERCVYFLHATDQRLHWPLSGMNLQENRKDTALFESLSAINERFAKLQDTLGAAMRHAALLSAEPAETFLKVLSFFEKLGVLESVAGWHICRATRNLAAHQYETDYGMIAEHFNTLHALIPGLYGAAARFVAYCRGTLRITPAQDDFAEDFASIVFAEGSMRFVP